MPADRLRIVLVAEESAGVQTLRSLAKGKHEIFMVLTSAKRGPVATASVAGLAKRLGYPVDSAARIKDPEFAHSLRAEGVDLLLYPHSLHLANAAVVDAPAIGSFNLHPGPMPALWGSMELDRPPLGSGYALSARPVPIRHLDRSPR